MLYAESDHEQVGKIVSNDFPCQNHLTMESNSRKESLGSDLLEKLQVEGGCVLRTNTKLTSR